MKDLSIEAYQRYMNVVKSNIKETKFRVQSLDKHERVSKLSYEEWIEFQKRKLNIFKNVQ